MGWTGTALAGPQRASSLEDLLHQGDQAFDQGNYEQAQQYYQQAYQQLRAQNTPSALRVEVLNNLAAVALAQGNPAQFQTYFQTAHQEQSLLPPRPALVADPHNLLQNGGFEQGLILPWGTGHYERQEGPFAFGTWWNSLNARAFMKRDRAQFHSGQSSLRVTNYSPSAPHVFTTLSQRISGLEPNGLYEISYYAKADNLSGGAVGFAIDAAWTKRLPPLPPGSYDWQPFKTTINIGHNDYIDFRILSVNTGTAWLDDIVVRKLPNPQAADPYQRLSSLLDSAQYQQALDLALSLEQQAQSNPNQLPGARYFLGRIYQALGQYDLAQENLQWALAHGYSRAIIELAEVDYLQGDYTLAQGRLWEAYQRFYEDQGTRSLILLHLSQCYLAENKLVEALDAQQKAYQILTHINDRDGQAEALFQLGMILLRQGQAEEAIKRFEQALQLWQQLGNRRGEALARNQLGYSLRQTGQLELAESQLRSSIEILESLRVNLADRHKISIFETQQSVYENLQEVLIEQGSAAKIAQALEIAERGRARAFVELLASGGETNYAQSHRVPPLSLTKIQQVAQSRKATLVEYSLLRQEKLLIWVVKPTGEVLFHAVPLPQGPTSVSLGKVIAQARCFGSFACERGIVEKSLASRGVTVAFNPALNPGRPSTNSNTRFNAHLQQLYQLLIQPIRSALPANTKVIIIPQGSLFLVPFGALQNSQGQYLIEQYPLLTAPSIQALSLSRPSPPQGPNPKQEPLVVGNPTMPQVSLWPGQSPLSLSSLPGAEQEARAIAALLKTTPLIGNQASKDLVLSRMKQASIIHLATHGKTDDQQGLQSWIALAPTGTGQANDGLLTAAEIFNLQLKAQLVVLSACETGQGRITGDGVIGLSRSFLSAGAASVVVTLWAVPDVPTTPLMTEFYRNLSQKMDKAEALRQAILTVRKTYPQPVDWAAFTLIETAISSTP
ncbi:hypothetical protein OLK001_08110 [Synechocystis sp. LKSZ1]